MPALNNPKILNALTVDVEDYFQVAALSETISPADWGKWPCRVERNTEKLLELFDCEQTKATFFVLGWVTERYPDLVRKIHKAGHEIACHGYSHQLVYTQTPAVFREETLKSKKLLEDIVGARVLGYRAASYSITAQSKWALDILCEAGFVYDSSIFPVHHDRYGMPGSPELPYLLTTENGNQIVEFPLTTAKIWGRKIPIAGGGYFRLFPYSFSRWGLSQSNRAGEPFVFYLHPWEIDPEQPRVDVSWLSRFRHYNNLDKCYGRLEQLMKDFSFTTMANVLQHKDLISADVAGKAVA